MSPFDFVNAINTSKKDLMTGSENDELAESSYVPFLVNKSLSYFPDSIMYANEMNRYHHLGKKLQFHYLLNTVRRGKRFAKWFKKEDDDNMQAVQKYYGYSYDKALQVIPLLSESQLTTIKSITKEWS